MKRILIALLLLIVAAGAFFVVWTRTEHSGGKPAPETKAEESEGSHLSHDESGRVVIKMDEETQRKMGLLVAKPRLARINPELKGYGKVLDPTPLAALMTELASAQAAAAASQAEFLRLKGLATQGNASESKLQTGEAAALRDQLAVQSAKERLILAWGKGVAEQTNLPAFIQPLTAEAGVLVRIDLPVGETLPEAPQGARLVTMAGNSGPAQFLGTTSSVDPQTLGRGAMLLHQPNTLRLMLGEAVTGYLELPGQPVTGVLVPNTAVVRAEGQGWVYVKTNGSDAFTRTHISLEHPVEAGWFVQEGITTNQDLVITGAQTLLSEELKSSLKTD